MWLRDSLCFVSVCGETYFHIIMKVYANRTVICKLLWQQHFERIHRETRVIKLAIEGVDLWVLEIILVQGLFMIITHQNVVLHFYC